MSKNSKEHKDDVIEFSVKNLNNSINDISMNNTSARYGPIFTDENYSHRNLNKIDRGNNSFSFVSTNTEAYSNISISVYGTDVRIKAPLKLGKTFSFFYINGYPWFIIGPQCKYNFSSSNSKLDLINFYFYK